MKIRNAVIFGAVFLLFFIFQPFGKTAFAATKATVTASSLHLRQGPSTSYSSLGLIKKGEVYTVLDSKNGWYKLQVGSKTGWSSGQYLKIATTSSSSTGSSTKPSSSAQGTLKVNTSVLNVRKSATTSSSKIGTVKSGETYQYYDKSGSWYKIKYGSSYGWVHGDYVVLVKTEAPAPVTEPSKNKGTELPKEEEEKSTGIPKGEVVEVVRALTSMKTSANLRSDTVTRLKKGDVCTVLDSKAEWIKVRYGSDEGWIKAKYVKIVGREDSEEGDNGNWSSENVLIDLNGLKVYETESRNVIAIPVTSKVRKSEGVDVLKPFITHEVDRNGNIAITVGDSSFTGSTIVNVNNDYVSSVSVEGKGSKGSLLTVNMVNRADYKVYSVPSKTTSDSNYSYLKSYIVISFEPSKSSKPASGEKNSEGKTKSEYLVVLDAGHGGTTSGAVSSGYMEKDLNMYIIDKLRDELQAQGYDTYLTRDGDYYVSLAERADSSNILKADIFVSVHLNSAASSSSNGTETLYDEGAHPNGKKLSELIQKHLVKELGTFNRGIKNRPDLYVLNSTHMPAALAEVMFMSNSQEMESIKRLSTRRKAARAIADAINEYFGFDN